MGARRSRRSSLRQLEPPGHPRGDGRQKILQGLSRGTSSCSSISEMSWENAVRALPAPNQMKLRVFESRRQGGPLELAPAGRALGDPRGTFLPAMRPSLRLSSWGSGFPVSGLRCCEHPFLFDLVFLSSLQPRTEAATHTDDFNLPRPVFSFKMGVIVPALQVISSFSLCPHLLLFKIVHQIPFRMCMFEVSSPQPFTNLLLIKKG